MKRQIIQQGAEAILIKSGNKLLKRRTKKSYRLPILDEKIRKSRTKKEAKLLEKISKLIPVPKLIKTHLDKKEINMQFIEGKKLSEHLEKLPNALEICRQIGKNIAILHNNNIIHGDLTTSNMIISNEKQQQKKHPISNKNKLYFIDFGLGFTSSRIEDKAVDLHLIKQALEAKHFSRSGEFFKHILEGYKISNKYQETLNRLKKVESRGRYKNA